MKLFKVSLNLIINISDLYKMKQYLTYILIGLAIAVVIGLGLYLKKRIDSLEDKVAAANAELFTVRNYMTSEKRLANDDMFSANTQRNVALEINNKVNNQEHEVVHESHNSAQSNSRQDEVNNNSPATSYDILQSEVTNLKDEINNIEDLIEDSSRESGSNSVNIDAQMYEQQLQNIETTGNMPIDSSLIQQVEQVHEVTQSASRGDDYVKNNNSEFEDLANVDLEHNSEFDELLNRDDTIQVNESDDENSGEVDSEEADTEQALDGTQQVNSSSGEDISEDIEIDSNLKNEIDVDVITNNYTKTQLINLCIKHGLSKSGNKTTLVNRLLESNVDLTSDNTELQTINSS